VKKSFDTKDTKDAKDTKVYLEIISSMPFIRPEGERDTYDVTSNRKIMRGTRRALLAIFVTLRVLRVLCVYAFCFLGVLTVQFRFLLFSALRRFKFFFGLTKEDAPGNDVRGAPFLPRHAGLAPVERSFLVD